MKTEQRIYVALAVLAALGFGVYAVQRRQKAEDLRHAPAASGSLPDFKISADDADKATKIEIKNADKGEVVLEKKDGKWRVQKPVDYPATESSVKSLLDNLKELKVKELIDPGKASYAEYGVDDAKAVHVVVTKEGTKILDAWFGKSGGRGQMARIAGKDGVYAVGGYSAYLYAREVKGWRDGNITKFEDDKVTKVELSNEAGDFVFTKEGEAWSAKKGKDKLERFDEAKAKDLVRAFKGLTAEDFGDGKSDADTGLDKPTATLTLSFKEGSPEKLTIGKTSSGESRYLKKDGNPQVFVISSWAAGWATAKADKFQKPEEKKDDKKKDEKKDEKKDDKKK